MSQSALNQGAYSTGTPYNAPQLPPVAIAAHPGRRFRPRLPRWIAKVLSYLKREIEAYEVETWKQSFRRCGCDVHISNHCSISGFPGLSVGDRTVINQFTHIFASGGVEIGSDVMISANCTISSVTHPVVARQRTAEPLVLSPVRIGDNVWIGMGARILPGITIGCDSIVGAGAVVTRNVPERCVVVGNPARLLRTF